MHRLFCPPRLPVSRRPARDCRGAFLLAFNGFGMDLFLWELSHDTPDGRRKWFRFGQLVNCNPGDLREASSGLERPPQAGRL
jgi:hypothetical protein